MSQLLRDSWQEAWELAIDLVVEDLGKTDLEARCRLAGATWDADRGVVRLDFLNRCYEIQPPDLAVTEVGTGEADEVAIVERILLLHYLNCADGTPPAGDWIAFAQLPGGDLYLPNFRARSADRVGRAFGETPAALFEAAAPLGGEAADFGDAAVIIQALPRVRLLVIVHGGDDEFPASADVLFDVSAPHYLSREDMIVLADKTVTRLCPRRPQ